MKDFLGVHLNSLFLSLIIFLVFFLLAIILKKVVRRLTIRLNVPSNLQTLFGNLTFYFLFIVGIISALGTLGINVSVIIASFGLTGFAVGFAFKDIIGNFLAGILILLYHPFEIGDYIKVSASEGRVKEINLRYTIMQGNDGEEILIPNSITFTKVIVVKKKG
ncbi:mechanosensitive ion channel [candidate division WOR-3 bacterium]|nr:mechanosensitive ion channel [candidate division WOR-3 bacterium]